MSEKTENTDFVHDHSLSLKDDAMREAVRRYGPKGDVEGALIFYRVATSPPVKVTPEDESWARRVMKQREKGHART